MSQLLWTQKQDIGPAPRSNAAMAYDATRARMVLFGGLAADNAAVLNDTWQWDGENWTERQDIGPAPRAFVGAEYDSARHRMLVFGGSGAAVFGDTWEAFERS